MTMVAGHLSTKHEVTLLTWEKPGEEAFYRNAPEVNLVQAGLPGGGWARRAKAIALRPAALRRQIRNHRPHVVLSFIDTTNILTLIACRGMSIPVVISERIDPSHDPRWLVRMMRLLFYRSAARIVVQTDRVAGYFPRGIRRRSVVIPNPIRSAGLRANPSRPNSDGRFRVVGVGRLEHQKGFDRLIEAFCLIASQVPLWDVVVFGEGSQRASLEAQVLRNNLQRRVFFPGVSARIEVELSHSHLICFPSRFEGFPNALAEAVLTGLPAVGFEGVSGVEELIVPGETGTLLPVNARPMNLASALLQLMEDGEARVKMGKAGTVHASQWGPEMIFGHWESVLFEAAGIAATAH